MSKKKSHGVQLLIRAVVKDPDGRVLSDTGEKPSKSFVIQFLEFIYYLFAVSSHSATATDGTEDPIYDSTAFCGNQFILRAPINISTHGLVVGTGTTAPTNTNYKLATQLTEGIALGNITHGVVEVVDAGIVGANVDAVFKRSFTNNTGVLITVKEAGAYVTCFISGTYYYFCIIRDVLGATIDVPDKCSLTVYYTLRTTV